MIRKIKESTACFMYKLGNGGYTAREIVLGGVVIFLVGVIIGMNSLGREMNFGCNSGNTVNNYGPEDDKEEE